MATIQLHIDNQELWSNLWGSGYELDPVNRNWLVHEEYNNGAEWNKWDKYADVTIWYIPEGADEQDEKYWRKDTFKQHCASKRVHVDTIATALSKAIEEGYRHVPCGGRITHDFEDWDSCVGDIILQLIAYGKEVWA